ncbi:4-oxalocrotonate tautomerase family protein [Sphingopyxis sp.]|uniref:tautomerase family protein n=1 Tax=Sphingopyxis sp. TaxID=1908224 RepID=UPI002B489933|nr:4-oxalocrotonate tautomerase family protein [Sphingopyxis sp.]HJS12111.1 4-oxalocrotonate tautomerase family protein [Sphingopyxis sp.]
MPIISVTLAEGRTVERKRALIRAITDAVVDAIDAKPDQVRIMINELPLDHYAVAGVTFGEKVETNGESV